MTENEGGTPRDPRDPQPETPPTQPLPGSTPSPGPDPTPTQPLPGEPYRAEQQPTPPQPAGQQPPHQQPTPQEPTNPAGPDAGAPYGQQGAPYGQQGVPTPYGQPGAPAAPQYGYGHTPPKNDLGVWALITGILSFVFCPLLLGIAAIITGTMSRRAADEGLANNRGMGTAGLILGWINVALVVLGIAFFVIALAVGLISGGFNGWDDMPNSNDWNY